MTMADNRCMIVAELSANHNGSLQTARDSIRAIADTGADAVKLQTYLPGSLTLDVRNDDFLLKGGAVGRTIPLRPLQGGDDPL